MLCTTARAWRYIRASSEKEERGLVQGGLAHDEILVGAFLWRERDQLCAIPFGKRICSHVARFSLSVEPSVCLDNLLNDHRLS